MLKYDDCADEECGANSSFTIAAKKWVEVLKELYSWATVEDKKELIQAHDYFAFQMAARSNNLKCLRQIYEWCDEDEKKLMLQCKDDSIFNDACNSDAVGAVKRLYSWADGDQRKDFMEYDNYQPFRTA